MNINRYDAEPEDKTEIKYKVNSSELVFKWNPKIHKQIKEYIPPAIERSKLKNERTVTQHLAKTIQYIQELEEVKNENMGDISYEGMNPTKDKIRKQF